MAAKLCLNMIVRNASASIERCLRTVAPHVDCYLILDTGSTDDTPAVIEATMAAAGVPGRVLSGEFRTFEQARNDALTAARDCDMDFDYLLLCDADEDLHVADPDFRADLNAPAYRLSQRHAGDRGPDVRLVRRDVRARYAGVTSEILDVGDERVCWLSGLSFVGHPDRSCPSSRFERDIALLTAALRCDPGNTRYVMHLAGNYLESGRHREAQEAYRRRVALGGRAEEVWYALLQIGRLAESLRQDDAVVVDAYLTAFQFRPTRAEPLVELARYYRDHGRRFALAHMVAEQARHLDWPEDDAYVDSDVYAWRARDEYATAAYWTGRYQASAEVNSALLADPALPIEQRDRVRTYLRLAMEHLEFPTAANLPAPRAPHTRTPGD